LSKTAQALDIDLSILDEVDDRTPGGHRRSARLVLHAEVERRRALAERLREITDEAHPVSLPPPDTTDDGS
jgi:hypothetical protein